MNSWGWHDGKAACTVGSQQDRSWFRLRGGGNLYSTSAWIHCRCSDNKLDSQFLAEHYRGSYNSLFSVMYMLLQ